MQITISKPIGKSKEGSGSADSNLDSGSKAALVSELQDSVKALTKIQKGIFNLQLQQQRDRHRLNLHAAMNAKNYNEVFYGSVIETCVFILVSLFQLYFIRRWFVNKLPKRGGAK